MHRKTIKSSWRILAMEVSVIKLCYMQYCAIQKVVKMGENQTVFGFCCDAAMKCNNALFLFYKGTEIRFVLEIRIMPRHALLQMKIFISTQQPT